MNSQKNRFVQNVAAGSWWSHLFAQAMRAAQRASRQAPVPSQAPLAAKPRGKMVEPDAVLEVSDGILSRRPAYQFEHLPVPVGDEAVILGMGFTRRNRCGVHLGLERDVSVSDRRRRPSSRGWASSPLLVSPRFRSRRLLCWRMVIQAHVHLAADGYHAMSVEACRPAPSSRPWAPAQRTRPTCSRRNSARRRCQRRWPTAGDSPASYSRGGVRPPWPDRRSRKSRSMVNGASPGPEARGEVCPYLAPFQAIKALVAASAEAIRGPTKL